MTAYTGIMNEMRPLWRKQRSRMLPAMLRLNAKYVLIRKEITDERGQTMRDFEMKLSKIDPYFFMADFYIDGEFVEGGFYDSQDDVWIKKQPLAEEAIHLSEI